MPLIIRRNLLLLFLFAFTFSYSQELSIGILGLKPPQLSYGTSVKDQYMSSTCWSFSSMSLLESELLKKGKGSVDLSEMFIARYSMIRKIQRHLKLKGSNFFTPGGQFHDAIWVIKNYGMVPEEAYPGKGRGELNHNHAEMDTVFSRLIKDCVSKGMTELNGKQNIFIDSVLNYYLGKVPDKFVYGGKNYTPHTFMHEYIDLEPDDYVEITSYTHHPFYSRFVLEDKYNWTEDEYYNVPLSDFSRITDSALQKGYTAGWDGDADDPDFHFWNGLAYLSFPVKYEQQQRQRSFVDHSTLLDHMMHIVGVSRDKTGRKWYYIKNSWGSSNDAGGFLFMRDDYFKIRTVAIIVNKKAIPAGIRKKLGI